jgi:hypothetical protein
MPQVQLPIFPAGSVEINRELACRVEGEQVIYFNGHLPVFSHAKSDLASFRRPNSWASLRTLLQLQRSGDSGSPRLSGSINRSKSLTSVASCSTVRLRPPPGLRIAPPEGTGACLNRRCRAPGHSRGTRDNRNTPVTDGETFRSGNQSAHPLIHCGQQSLETTLYRVYFNH